MVKSDIRRDLDVAWEDAEYSADNLLRASPEDAARATAAMLTLISCQMSEMLAILAHQAKCKVHPPVMVVHEGEGFISKRDPFDLVDQIVAEEVGKRVAGQEARDPVVVSDNEHVASFDGVGWSGLDPRAGGA